MGFICLFALFVWFFWSTCSINDIWMSMIVELSTSTFSSVYFCFIYFEFLFLGAYELVFYVFMLNWLFIFIKCPLWSLVTFVFLISNFPDIDIATPTFFTYCFHVISFPYINLHFSMSVYLKCVGSCFCIYSDNLYLSAGVFTSFTCKVTVDMLGSGSPSRRLFSIYLIFW